MPFSLKTAPTSVQRIINIVLPPVPGKHTQASLVNVLIFSNNFEQHCHHVNETLALMNKAGIKVNLNKCRFAVKDFKNLSFRISVNGISLGPYKVRSIKELPQPTDLIGVRRFWGCISFFRRHVPNFVTLSLEKASIQIKCRTWCSSSSASTSLNYRPGIAKACFLDPSWYFQDIPHT